MPLVQDDALLFGVSLFLFAMDREKKFVPSTGPSQPGQNRPAFPKDGRRLVSFARISGRGNTCAKRQLKTVQKPPIANRIWICCQVLCLVSVGDHVGAVQASGDHRPRLPVCIYLHVLVSVSRRVPVPLLVLAGHATATRKSSSAVALPCPALLLHRSNSGLGATDSGLRLSAWLTWLPHKHQVRASGLLQISNEPFHSNAALSYNPEFLMITIAKVRLND